MKRGVSGTGSARRLAAVWLVTCGLMVTVGTGLAQAQGMWDARLAISPFPSPYLSDWESNPSIGMLTITNAGADRQVLLSYRVTDRGGRLLASGRSDPQLIPAGAPTVLTDFVNMSGRSQHDQALEDQMRRTGRLPEGDNTTCVAVTDAGGFVLAEDCATFSIVYPDPPALIGPLDEATLTSAFPIFQWTPLQVPPSFHLTYVVRVSEVLTGQNPLQALTANIPVFETTTGNTSLEYPIAGLPLVEGKTYAWRVQALDQNGYAASSGEGRSEVWTFNYSSTGGGPITGSSAMTLDIVNTRIARPTPGGDENTSGLLEICSKWNQEPGGRVQLGFPMNIDFPGNLSAPAALHRFNVPGTSSRVWALVANTPKYSVMAYGDCDGPAGQVPWPRWMAVRTRAGAASVDWLTTGQDDQEANTTRRLEFGVLIFTLQETTVEAPEGFAAVNDYLQGHSIDVMPGVNVFGILQLKEQRFWAFLQRAFGYDDKELELQGFLGVNLNAGVGFSGDTREGNAVDVSAQLDFLTLRAALPARNVVRPAMSLLFDRSRLEFEFIVNDSASHRLTGDDPSTLHNQFHFILNMNQHLTLKDGVSDALRLPHGSEVVSTTGLDLATEFSSATTELKLVRRYALDHGWRLGQSQFVVGHPELEIGYLLTGENAGDLLITLTGAVGWGEQESIGKLALTLVHSAQQSRLAQPTVYIDRLYADVARWRDVRAQEEEQLAQATTAADRARYQGYIDEKNSWIDEALDHINTFESLNVTRQAREAQSQALFHQPKCFGVEGWYCSYRLSLGNMGVLDLVTLVRQALFEATN